MENKNTAVQVEGSKVPAQVHRTMNVRGLEDMPTSMIPLPFYKLVQPGSTNISVGEGVDAQVGTFFMGDVGKSVPALRFLLLRSKRRTREVIDERTGMPKKIITTGILGFNLDKDKVFILDVSVASFSNVGRLMGEIKERKMANAWDFPIMAITEKREEDKVINGRSQKVKFWVIKFELMAEPVSEEMLQKAEDAYLEFAASLDRNDEEEVVSQPVPDGTEDVDFGELQP